MYFYFRTVALYCFGVSIIELFCVMFGLMVYTKYADCDLAQSGQIGKREQILPYFVLDVAGQVPGLPGFFIAGIVSSALR